jgi:hypothetical protein
MKQQSFLETAIDAWMRTALRADGVERDARNQGNTDPL